MERNTIGLILGGFVPALLFGVAGLCQKVAIRQGIGVGPILVAAGVTITLVGLGLTRLLPAGELSLRSVAPAAMLGASWGLGAGLVCYALHKYDVALSKLVPLYNMNTLVAVVLALWLYAEWEQLNATQLFIGALLVTGGAVLVARA